MATYGPNSPGTVATDVVGVTWSNTSFVTANDASYATVTLHDGACFLANTKIYNIDNSFRFIENINVGDIISDAYGKNVIVLKCHKILVNEYLFIESLLDSVKVTDYHPFMLEDGTFKEIKDIEVGEAIYGNKIIAKTKIIDNVYVYNLSVSESETYIANQFKVHNK